MMLKYTALPLLIAATFSCSQAEQEKADGEIDPDQAEYEEALRKLGVPDNPKDVYPEPLNVSDSEALRMFQDYLEREQYGSIPLLRDSNEVLETHPK